MMPSSPQSVTIGTGERNIVATTALRLGDQLASRPRGVASQSKSSMRAAISPPPSRNGWWSSRAIAPIVIKSPAPWPSAGHGRYRTTSIAEGLPLFYASSSAQKAPKPDGDCQDPCEEPDERTPAPVNMPYRAPRRGQAILAQSGTSQRFLEAGS